MRKFMNVAVLLIAAVMVLGGCQSNSLKKENALLMQENESLRGELSQRNSALDEAHMSSRDYEIQMAQLRRDLSDAQTQPQTKMSSRPVANVTPFDDIPGVQGSVGAGEITATVASDVLFDPGKDSLKSSAKRSLDAVAQVLNNSYTGRPIRISGHTDSDPIRKSGHKSNYHLAFKRSFAVREYLQSRGVQAERMYLASYGPDRPEGSKNTSRRVEVTVIVN